jgi:hypothetical protein
MVVPPRRQRRRLTLGGALLLLAGVPAAGPAQQAPPKAITVQARVTILPAVDTYGLGSEAFWDVGPAVPPTFGPTNSSSVTTLARARPLLQRAGPEPSAAGHDRPGASAGPPVVRTLAWSAASGETRLVRYFVAVIS